MRAAGPTRAQVRAQASKVRKAMQLAETYADDAAYDAAARVGGEIVAAALELSRMYTARADGARQARQAIAPNPPCPHCGSTDVDRGATGLDECRSCGGLSRAGRKLREAEA